MIIPLNQVAWLLPEMDNARLIIVMPPARISELELIKFKTIISNSTINYLPTK